ncbi:MAG: TlpA family protein disulfide reductase [bacterium]|nr:TlpA family protein disulfide reductase [bacterium]
MVRLSALLIFILVLAGCGSGDGTAQGTTKVVEGVPASSTQSALALPDFNLERIGGGHVRLSSLRGKIVVLDFWDTWCPPCRQAMPHLQQLSNEFPDDVVVVGVAMGRNGKPAVETFVKQYGLTFPVVLMDEKFDAVRAFAPYGGVNSLPTTFIIDTEGVVKQQIVGFNPRETDVYETAVRQLIGA